MRPAVIRLIDLGSDDDFALVTTLAQTLVKSLTARWGADGLGSVAEVELVRTRDAATVRKALQAPATVIHLTAHGESTPDELGFWSEDSKSYLSLSDLAEQFAEDGEGIEAGTVLADCCGTAQGRFVRAIRDCIEGPITYIGATRSVDWYEGTAYSSAFYAALLRNRGRGLTPHDRGLQAAERAALSYAQTVGRASPYVAKQLQQSRAARRALLH